MRRRVPDMCRGSLLVFRGLGGCLGAGTGPLIALSLLLLGSGLFLVKPCVAASIEAPSPTPTGIVLVSRLSDARASASLGASDTPLPHIQTDFLPANLSNSAWVGVEQGFAEGSCSSNSSIVADTQAGTLQVTGDGTASSGALAFSGIAIGSASAKLIMVSFTLLDGSFPYTLGGQLLAQQGFGSIGSAASSATARLTMAGVTVFEVVANHPPEVTLSEHGILQPGDYVLTVELNADAQCFNAIGADGNHSNSSANFSFTLGPTPTPTPTPTATPTATPPPSPSPSATEPPPVWFSPDHDDFSSVIVGSSSDPFTFTLYTIPGNGATGVYIFGPDASSFSFTVKPEISEPNLPTITLVTVTFSPTSAGPKLAYLSASCACNPGYATLTGTGLPCSACTPTPAPTATPSATPETLLGNISTRLRVEAGDNALIGGFVVTGTQPKRVIVRAIGPSLGLTGALVDPILELRGSAGALITSNDNWRSDQEMEIMDTGIPPTSDFESAIVGTLPANGSAYTAVVQGTNNGSGIGLVEVYDLDQTVDSKLANISTRGLVQSGDNAMIAGTIVLGQGTERVLVRAIGPSLPLEGKLADPTLELRDGNGMLIRANDNWRSDQETEINATGIPPTNDSESAIVATLPANGAAYTAIVRGVGDTTGVALVEVYGLTN